MSALIGHAKAARILAQELTARAQEEDQDPKCDRTVVRFLARMAQAHLSAAGRMEQAMREEATGRDRYLAECSRVGWPDDR